MSLIVKRTLLSGISLLMLLVFSACWAAPSVPASSVSSNTSSQSTDVFAALYIGTWAATEVTPDEGSTLTEQDLAMMTESDTLFKFTLREDGTGTLYEGKRAVGNVIFIAYPHKVELYLEEDTSSALDFEWQKGRLLMQASGMQVYFDKV